jgi:mannose-1-phosphate guanylyltransferase
MTVKRILPLIPIEQIYIITGQEIEQEVRRQLPRLPEQNVIPEPIGKDTAAAVGLSAVWIGKGDEDATMVVLPADHFIFDEKEFLACVSTAVEAAESGKSLVVFGIKPSRHETGYGYIKAGKKIGEKACEVETFVEKPDEEMAKKFLADGRYYWNSGMFVWTYQAIMTAIERYMPQLFSGLQKIKAKPEKGVIAEVYNELEDVSIDYGIMEKAENKVMVIGDFGWDDVGSWLAMERIQKKDREGNVSLGKFTGIDTHNSIIIGDKALITAIGISDMIIVATDDAILICPKEKAQEVKKMVKKLIETGKKEYVE